MNEIKDGLVLLDKELERLHALLETEHKEWAKDLIANILSPFYTTKYIIPKGTESSPDQWKITF